MCMGEVIAYKWGWVRDGWGWIVWRTEVGNAATEVCSGDWVGVGVGLDGLLEWDWKGSWSGAGWVA